MSSSSSGRSGVDPAWQHRTGQRNLALDVFPVQQNVGQEIFKGFRLDRGGLSGEHTLVNVLVVGPAYRDLKAQTRERMLVAFERTRNLRYGIVNSSSLTSWKEQTERGSVTTTFLQDFEDNPNHFHLVIHDEAHWGIRDAPLEERKQNRSKVNKFFRELLGLYEALEPKRLLRILLVSATPFVFSKAILPDFSRVSWQDLSVQFPAYFLPENFRSWRDQNYICKPIKPAKGTMSQALVRAYMAAFLHRLPPTHTIQATLNAFRISAHASYVIKLETIQDADQLAVFFHNQNPEFAVVKLFGPRNDRRSVPRQLQDQGRPRSRFEDLVHALIIAVDRLSVGDTLPKSVAYYEVRARYTGEESTAATIIQDFGRCSGYDRQDITILAGVPKDSITERNLDQLVGKGAQTNPGHPEHPGHSHIYSQFQNEALVLEAEPQIGKTGAVISFIDLLVRRIQEQQQAQMKRKLEEEDQATKRPRTSGGGPTPVKEWNFAPLQRAGPERLDMMLSLTLSQGIAGHLSHEGETRVSLEKIRKKIRKDSTFDVPVERIGAALACILDFHKRPWSTDRGVCTLLALEP